MSINQNCEIKNAKAELNQGLSAYLPGTVLQGQARSRASVVHGIWLFFVLVLVFCSLRLSGRFCRIVADCKEMMQILQLFVK